jgi:hypothetical protein
MQISASNLLVAAQQVRSPTAAPAPLRTEPPIVTNATMSAEEPKFEAMAFKTTSPTNTAPSAKPDNPFAPAKKLGSQLDIRV